MFAGSAGISGQRGNNANVVTSESTTREAAGPADTPGRGRNRKMPAMRASTSANEYSVETRRARSMCITAEVAENARCVRGHVLQHPGQQDQETSQEGSEAWNGAESRVLKRGHDLHKIHHDAHHEADQQQRCANQESGPESLAHGVNYRFGCQCGAP